LAQGKNDGPKERELLLTPPIDSHVLPRIYYNSKVASQ